MKDVRYTGNRRFRIHNRIFGKPLMVLQVQVSGVATPEIPPYTETRRWWEDAEMSSFDSRMFVHHDDDELKPQPQPQPD